MAEILWADYSWARPNVDRYEGVMRYLDADRGTRPDLTGAEVNDLHQQGKPVGLIWQADKGGAGEGKQRGAADAQRANREADKLGAPDTAAIFYTVDSGSLSPKDVAPYFAGVRSVPGRPVGIYGSADICDWAHGVGIDWRWQTIAWSRGRISKHAHLYQRDHNTQDKPPTGLLDRNVKFADFPAWQPETVSKPKEDAVPERWIKEAEDLKSNGQSGTMSRNHSGVKVTWHVTVSPSGGHWFDSMHRTLTNKRAEPHILYDPLTDRLGQYFPFDRSARALANDGDRPTNRDGKINIQIEVVAQPDGFTDYWKPGPNYKALMRAIRSWGIPDQWPAGRLSQHGNDGVSRSWSNYRKSGHFGHCNVPGNNHWDPGPIDQAAIFTGGAHSGGAQSVPFPKPSPRPSGGGFTPAWTPTGKLSVKQIQKIVGVKADSLYGQGTKDAVAAYQRKLGVTDDGYWGEATESAHFASKRKPKRNRLVVDGLRGPATIKALQKWVGAPVDGALGPVTIGHLQRKLGVPADSILGPVTVKALQRKVGARADGAWGKRTTKRLQKFLNKALR